MGALTQDDRTQPAFSARCGDPSQRLFLMRQFMRHLGGSYVPLTSHLGKILKIS